MFRKILIVLALIIVVFLIVVALQPGEFQVSRSTTIAATPAEIFPEVNDFHRMEKWSTWSHMDPAMKVTYEGPEAGEGAIYRWVSDNNKVGQGSMTIVKSQPPELIRINLEFIKPFAGVCPIEFTFRPDPAGTAVTWTMSGKNSFVAKAMHLFMNMDNMIGAEFEKSLAHLKKIVENESKTPEKS